jgi:phenylalanyl-tRNA synthetase beta chain
MRISADWLSEWVDVPDDIAGLAHALTMAGLEVEGIDAAAGDLTGIVVGQVLAAERHPDADKLTVCRVNVGAGEPLSIVCGAPNVRVGLKVPVALEGAHLPNGSEIRRARLRGVESRGMLCSARELGLGDDTSGLLELPSELDTGRPLVDALRLDDRILEINLTPNRGDCMSLLGVAREVAAVLARPLHAPGIEPVAAAVADRFDVRMEAPAACPTFVARVIKGVDGSARSPFWLRERLRRAGLRPVNAIVDVTNYVMLELGQPMHPYDLAQLSGAIVVRHARASESLTLLDGREVALTDDVLVIADERQPLGLAGVMGGEGSGIAAATRDVLLEVAFFEPAAVAGRARRFGLVTDASQRFERGVDPQLQARAAERATRLIVELAGGRPGPCVVHRAGAGHPAPASIRVRPERVQRVLGAQISRSEMESRLASIACEVTADGTALSVVPPSWRFDLAIEEDLIEEVGRLYGFDNIPETDAPMRQVVRPATELRPSAERIALLLADRGYREVVTYSFTSPQVQDILHPGVPALTLSNPISAELAAMRLSLWPGLIEALRVNQRRQRNPVRLFEIGRRYDATGAETEVVAGLAAGYAVPEQWGIAQRPLDFFDLKGDIEALLDLTGERVAFEFEPCKVPALHPGQSARILRTGRPVGVMGALHPDVVRQLDLTYGAFVYELERGEGLRARLPEFHEISKFPSIRRDLAVVVDESTSHAELARVVRASAGDLLTELTVFDVYRGPGIDKGKKSIALGLNLQDTSRTLTDLDAEAIVARVIEQLGGELGATIRDR